MVVGPAFEPEGWVGVVEGGGAQDVEGGLGGSLRVGDEVVDGLLAVDVGGMLLRAADGGVYGFEEGSEEGKQEEEDGGGGPIVLRGDAPAGAETAEGVAKEMKGAEEKDEAADKA